MGIPTDSSECQEKLRVVLEGLRGIQHIQDDIVVHRKREEHDRRLEALLTRLQ